MSDSENCRYRLDPADLLVSVGDGWEAFARHNRGYHLHGADVIGRPIWDFVSGDEVAGLYRDIFARVRSGGEPHELRFRCDAPDRFRLMALRIEPAGGGHLELATTALDSHERPVVRRMDYRAMRDARVFAMCSFCHDVQTTQVPGWVPAARAVAEWSEPAALGNRGVQHVACERCRDSVLGAERGHSSFRSEAVRSAP